MQQTTPLIYNTESVF